MLTDLPSGMMPNLGPKTQSSKERGLRHMRMLVWGGVLTLMVGSWGWAENNVSVVRARAVMANDAAHAHSPVKVAVLAQVAPGYHINAHKPSLDYLIPTELKVDPNQAFTVKNVVYPKGTPKKFEFSDVPLSVYEGSVVVGVLLESGESVSPGTYTLNAKFAYQACNDHACLAPTSVPLSLIIKIVPPNVPLKPVEPDVFERLRFD